MNCLENFRVLIQSIPQRKYRKIKEIAVGKRDLIFTDHEQVNSRAQTLLLLEQIKTQFGTSVLFSVCKLERYDLQLLSSDCLYEFAYISDLKKLPG